MRHSARRRESLVRSLLMALIRFATVLISSRNLRRQLVAHARMSSRRTLAQRVMEILVDSGLVYTSIWVRLEIVPAYHIRRSPFVL